MWVFHLNNSQILTFCHDRRSSEVYRQADAHVEFESSKMTLSTEKRAKNGRRRRTRSCDKILSKWEKLKINLLPRKRAATSSSANTDRRRPPRLLALKLRAWHDAGLRTERGASSKTRDSCHSWPDGRWENVCPVNANKIHPKRQYTCRLCLLSLHAPSWLILVFALHIASNQAAACLRLIKMVGSAISSALLQSENVPLFCCVFYYKGTKINCAQLPPCRPRWRCTPMSL